MLLSQVENILNLVTNNESVHCGISFEIFLSVHSQTKLLSSLHYCRHFNGCLSFVVVVVVFDLSKICIQLLPFCVVLLFLLLIIINLMYILLTIQLYYYEFRLQYYLSKHHF